MCKRLACLTSLILLLGLNSAAQATDYYVSPSGDNSNAGTSPAKAWKTIGKVNGATFRPGDSIFFEGGKSLHRQNALVS